jgi:hypothetical protein
MGKYLNPAYWLRRLLFAYTARLPARFIDLNESPYLERYYVGQLFGFTFYLHRFVGSDGERLVHDHPWVWSAALVLVGGYREERVTGLCPDHGWRSRRRRMFPGRLNVIREMDFHRIESTAPETWTLFFHTPRCKRWGFLFPEAGSGTGYVPHKSESDPRWWRYAMPGGRAPRVPFAV